MERDNGSSTAGVAGFHPTRWTIVIRAAQSRTPGGYAALGELCRLYWYRMEPIEFLTAEKMYDARWAMTLLSAVKTLIHRLRYPFRLREIDRFQIQKDAIQGSVTGGNRYRDVATDTPLVLFTERRFRDISEGQYYEISLRLSFQH